MDRITKLIINNWEDLHEKIHKIIPSDKTVEVEIALHRLKENFYRLDLRLRDYNQIENEIHSLSKEEDYVERLHFLQLKLVDRLEAFHQQVYSTLSTLILALNYLRLKGIKDDHPINSIQKFLEFLKEKYSYKSILHDQIATLIKSVDFRSKFIDHPQQHAVHDWMTYGYENEVYLIYFIRHGDEVYAISGNPDPASADFKPPVNCKDDFYVAPSKVKTFKAVERLIIDLLDLKE